MEGRKTSPLIHSPDSMPGFFSSADLYQRWFAFITINSGLHTYLHHAIKKHPLNHRNQEMGQGHEQ